MVFLSMENRPGISVVSVDNECANSSPAFIKARQTQIGIITGPMAWWRRANAMSGCRSSGRAGLKAHLSQVVNSDDWSQ